ncbi:hypothetical protein Tco_1543672, partial [Tanacetum coccineum]
MDKLTDPFVSVEDYDNPDLADEVPENATLGSESEGNIDASARGGITFSQLDDEARDAYFSICLLLLASLIAACSRFSSIRSKLISNASSFLAMSTSAVLNLGILISAGMTASVP